MNGLSSLPYIKIWVGQVLGGRSRLVLGTLSLEMPIGHAVLKWIFGCLSLEFRAEVQVRSTSTFRHHRCIRGIENYATGWDFQASSVYKNRRPSTLSPEPANVRRLEMRRKANNGQREKEIRVIQNLKPSREIVSRTIPLYQMLQRGHVQRGTEKWPYGLSMWRTLAIWIEAVLEQWQGWKLDRGSSGERNRSRYKQFAQSFVTKGRREMGWKLQGKGVKKGLICWFCFFVRWQMNSMCVGSWERTASREAKIGDTRDLLETRPCVKERVWDLEHRGGDGLCWKVQVNQPKQQRWDFWLMPSSPWRRRNDSSGSREGGGGGRWEIWGVREEYD